MIVVDTTVLVYAVGADHPLRDPCQALLEAIRQRQVRATTTSQVIQEFVHVRARRRDRADAATLGRWYAQAFAPLLRTAEDDLHVGLDLFESHSGLGCFDAVLAAVARRNDASAIVSADRGFAGIETPRWLDPAAPDFVSSIRSLPGR